MAVKAPTARSHPSRPVVARLVTVTGPLSVLTVVHDLDHLRQGRSLPPVLYLVAVGALASLAATWTVLVRRPRWARPVALVQGLATVAGVGAVHALPQWSRFTDSYSAARADPLSWAIIIASDVGRGGPRRDRVVPPDAGIAAPRSIGTRVLDQSPASRQERLVEAGDHPVARAVPLQDEGDGTVVGGTGSATVDAAEAVAPVDDRDGVG
jgi:hypothetical protein